MVTENTQKVPFWLWHPANKARESPLRSEVIMGGLSRRKCCFMYWGRGEVFRVLALCGWVFHLAHIQSPGLGATGTQSIEGGCHSTGHHCAPKTRTCSHQILYCPPVVIVCLVFFVVVVFVFVLFVCLFSETEFLCVTVLAIQELCRPSWP